MQVYGQIIIGLLLKRFQYPKKEIKSWSFWDGSPEKYTVLTVKTRG